MKIGFSLSPGGLLFPYHLGALSSLTTRGYITDSTPLAGSSAGAIAVASHAAGVPSESAFDACIRISDKCQIMGGARGNLLPLLEDEMNAILPRDAHLIVNEREGMAAVAYHEIFPKRKSVLKSQFESREDFIESVCNSSMFPFFSTNWPFVVRSGPRSLPLSGNDSTTTTAAAVDNVQKGEETNQAVIVTSNGNNNRFALPRLVVDGFFTVPRDRFGCPEFPSDSGVDRTVTISVFPHASIGLSASDKHDQISPKIDGDDAADLTRLFQGATAPSPPEVHREVYERGYDDATRWAIEEETRGAIIF